MAIRSYIMAKTLFECRGIKVAPFLQKDVLAVFDDICDENKREFADLYDEDVFDALMTVKGVPDVFVVTYQDKPMAVMGLQGFDAQNGILWSLFTNHFKRNRTKFYRASAQLIEFFHTHYYILHVNTWVQNEGIMQWLAWLGFGLEEIEETEDHEGIAHFVRCNPNRKNVYALSSRPVKH